VQADHGQWRGALLIVLNALLALVSLLAGLGILADAMS